MRILPLKRLYLLLIIVFFGIGLYGCRTEISDFIGWHENGEPQIYEYHTIMRVHDEALFQADGEINQAVLANLFEILDTPSLDPWLRFPMFTWPSRVPYQGEPMRVVNASDFSEFVVPADERRDRHESGAIVLRLFEEIPNRTGVRNHHLTEFTSQWWQLVMRTAYDGSDVLTLWMLEPYRLSAFSGNRFTFQPNRFEFDTVRTAHGITRNDQNFVDLVPGSHSGHTRWNRMQERGSNSIRHDEAIVNRRTDFNDFWFEGNYGASIARANLLRDTNFALDFFQAQDFFTTPANLPGNWQSSDFQTGRNAQNRFYSSGDFQQSRFDVEGPTPQQGSNQRIDGLGAASRIWGNWDVFNLGNGLDGKSIGPFGTRNLVTGETRENPNNLWFNSQVQSAFEDLFWLPSDFETRSMGHNQDDARMQTFLIDADDRDTLLRTNTIDDTRPGISHGRSGWWRLNGFDRSFSAPLIGVHRAWLRSSDSIAVGNVNTIYHTGNRYSHGAIDTLAMRPGTHLNLIRLRQQLIINN